MALTKKQHVDQKESRQQHQLYQTALLAHHKQPIGFEVAINADASHEGVNPACGDEITVSCEIKHQHEASVITAIAFHGDSCAICRASASIMCQEVQGKTLVETQVMSRQLTGALSTNISMIGELAEQFSPLLMIQQFPVRKQCALLPWNTLMETLKCLPDQP
ncbi:SUF system NifU family Fe-S cluster assembly protein [Thalassotalea sp. 1_MG-2023]|uniref:Fe-S cluster assembly sulfur transfer protein SufU n=1 Tax=Thalassotalea sp. 1_MG-2023 TaxID=3062680 RepID=UPI0026E36D3A|nr:SUF system NifU family Fe-S cluster assembly protein [Thalassotalea sp. 1_MG-2023]MDO6426387.1 SUF system NifU family Fe-S cluster assembly protein [Thalassotalea sp. 1_MG-2023]